MICDNVSVNSKSHLTFAGFDTVELAKKYGSDMSSSFVNGVLAKVVKR